MAPPIGEWCLTPLQRVKMQFFFFEVWFNFLIYTYIYTIQCDFITYIYQKYNLLNCVKNQENSGVIWGYYKYLNFQMNVIHMIIKYHVQIS